jgi:xylan 1,4-beta-xylosidase
MASSDNTIFWYRGATAPPRRMSDWTKLIEALAHHLIDRYGLAEVAAWRFECWNEPNLSFWAADQTAYFELYAATAKALKQVDPRLQVGGPATAQLMWISEFLDYCAAHAAPVDFVSAHSYADDPQENLFGRQMGYPREEVMPRAMARARAKIAASAFPHLPLVISEWSSQNPAFIAQMIRDCAPLCDTFSYWTFDNVFEEQGPIAGYDNSAYGLIGQGGVAKPSFHTFVLLHRLGDQRIDTGDAPILATRRADGGWAVLAWNLIPIKAEHGTAGNPVAEMGREPMADGPAKTVTLSFDGAGDRLARIYRVDPSADPAERLYQAMGRPSSPTAAQFDQLHKASVLPEPEIVRLQNGRVQLEIPANGVALVEI